MAGVGFGSIGEIPPGTTAPKGEMKWSTTDGTEFKVRKGPEYKKNREKACSSRALYTCVGADLVTSGDVISDLYKTVSFGSVSMPDAKDLPSLIITNCQLPMAGLFSFGKDCGISKVSYNVINPEIAALVGTSQEPRQLKLLRRMIEKGYSDTSLAWKAIGRVDDSLLENLPQVLHKFNGKPALVTESGTLTSGVLPNGRKFLEIDIDIRKWSLVARTTFSQTKDLGKSLTLHIAFLIQGTEDDELPEQIICASLLHNADSELAMEIENTTNGGNGKINGNGKDEFA